MLTGVYSLSCLHDSSFTPTVTSIPASLSLSNPFESTIGFGSTIPTTTLFHFSFNHNFSTWWSSSIVITRFQAHICCSILSQVPSISQSKYLQVSPPDSNSSATVSYTDHAD
ncbi:hypothetical protein Pint_24389 [Pistacia integerrima]|uniref:Uncharacterized protein n=1 Tax=Pistacia integerrima TaxID=434235 RepID=A0ACC0YE87_9ROSI|nr:hypothetical protein Pint_24389 [Pistacia integerrima]